MTVTPSVPRTTRATRTYRYDGRIYLLAGPERCESCGDPLTPQADRICARCCRVVLLNRDGLLHASGSIA